VSTRIFLEQIDQSGASGNHVLFWNGTSWAAGTAPAGSLTLASLPSIGANSILGNNTGSSAAPSALTGTQTTALLDTYTGATSSVAGVKGLVPSASTANRNNFLRGDGTWASTSATWGAITGTLSNQTDLSNALANKLDTSHAGSGGSAHALVVAGGAAGFMTGSDKTKLDSVSSGATANSTDAFLLDRANHTGTEAITTNTFTATARFAGRITAGAGAAEELTGTQATTLLDLATGSLKGLMSSSDFTKLSGVAAGATANSPDSTLLNRANHTGTQAVTTISFSTTARFLGRNAAGAGTGEELTGTQATALLDVATGALKGLMSSSDFNKLSGIASGATANQTDTYLLSRANHTGTQAWSTITSTPTTVAGYGITDAVSTGMLGAANGIATLGSDSKIPASQLPAIAITSVFVVANQTAQLALSAQEGDLAVRTDQSKTYINNGGTAGTMADWTEMLSPTAGVTSVNGQSGTVVLTKTDIGLGNVDNTADSDKPVSAPQQTALDLKLNATHAGTGGSAHAVVISGGAAGFMTGTDKAKLDGIATGATANSTDAFLLGRANHTGTQAITTNTFTASGKIAGRITTGAGVVEELSGTQVTSLLDVFGTSKGLVPGTASNTTQFLRADGSWSTPPNTGVWGSITGTLTAQSDLQTALDDKLSVSKFHNVQVDGGKYNFLEIGSTAAGGGGIVAMGADDPTSGWPYFSFANAGGSDWGLFGSISANSRITITGSKAWEFTTTPYVGTNVIYHAGNLTKATLGLGNVDNTSDANKPVSTAQQTALNTKLTVYDNHVEYGPNAWAIPLDATTKTCAFSTGDVTQGVAMMTLQAGSTAHPDWAGLSYDLPDWTAGFGIGGLVSTTRIAFNVYGDGSITGVEFNATPYVGSNVIYHAGNLAVFTASTDGLVPKPTTATGKFLRDDGTWQAPNNASDSFAPFTTTGTGASQNITIPVASTAAQVLVFVNGIFQTPDVNYTVSGTTLTITTASAGDSITILRYL
jgi:hypothetical protein